MATLSQMKQSYEDAKRKKDKLARDYRQSVMELDTETNRQRKLESVNEEDRLNLSVLRAQVSHNKTELDAAEKEYDERMKAYFRAIDEDKKRRNEIEAREKEEREAKRKEADERRAKRQEEREAKRKEADERRAKRQEERFKHQTEREERRAEERARRKEYKESTTYCERHPKVCKAGKAALYGGYVATEIGFQTGNRIVPYKEFYGQKQESEPASESAPKPRAKTESAPKPRATKPKASASAPKPKQASKPRATATARPKQASRPRTASKTAAKRTAAGAKRTATAKAKPRTASRTTAKRSSSKSSGMSYGPAFLVDDSPKRKRKGYDSPLLK